MKMYNFFITPVIKQIYLHGVIFIPKQIIMQSSMRCSFCHFYHGKVSKLMHHHICTHTTILSPVNQSKMKKKVKQRTKKYVELLEVLNQITNNKRSTVQNAKVSDTVIVANQSGIITDKSHKIEDITCNKTSFHSKNLNKGHKRGTFCNKETKGKKFFNYHTSTKDLKKALLNGEEINTIIKSNMKETTQENKSKHLIDNINKEQYIEVLLAHMQVYLSCGMLKKANETLIMFSKSKLHKFQPRDECILLYNILLEAYASKKDFAKVLELYDKIKTDFLIRIPQTYAHIFCALGETKLNEEQFELFIKVKNEMYANNISFNDILTKSHFKYNQREIILGIIAQLEPTFEPLNDLENPLIVKYTHNVLTKTSMENNYQSPVKGLLTIEELKEALNIQLQNERTIKIQIDSIDKSSKNINLIHEEKLNSLEKYWEECAVTAFRRNVQCLKEKEMRLNKPFILYPFLKVLNEEDYVNVIMQEIKKLALGSETYSTCLSLLYIDAGKHIFKKYEIKIKEQTGVMDTIINVYHNYLKWYLNTESISQFSNINNRSVWQYFEQEGNKFYTSINAVHINWPPSIIAKIGKFLYNIIVNDIIIQPELLKGYDFKCSTPSFYTLFRNRGNYLSEQIKPHPFVSKLYKESRSDKLTFDSHLIPSYSPSRPWTSVYSGGYILSKTQFVRIHNSKDNTWYKLINTNSQQLHAVFDCLNQLSSIPWTINTAILDILIQIFQDGGSMELNVPQSVSVLVPPPSIKKDASAAEKRNAAILMAKYKQEKDEMYSLWCDTLYKLSLANHFRSKIFWLPHNLDFRGRVYPVPPHLNHLSSDLGRSLLLFANGKPLGPHGLDWLKLHVINLTNLKRTSSLKERLEYANENIENILDSASNPLTGKMWWKQSDEPWQTLAGCIEIANALKAPSIEEYKSTFPVHQDGSCNGLQHYAALGRDQIGAESINLDPYETPKDVYSAVAGLIEKQREIDDKNGIKIAQLLRNHVKRKIIKQTVMTTVYGVTTYGAKLQISKQLRDISEFPAHCIWYASIYLTEKTFNTLGTMFKSAREIQAWLTTCAKIISSIYYKRVQWITPLGFPIIQPYMKHKMVNKKQEILPDALKQKNAFAANFIHSLDSTHMMLTSLHCNKADITFVSVHDCFWTHACSVDKMNKICREQFIALHTETILEDLANFFIQHYKAEHKNLNVKDTLRLARLKQNILTVPKKGTFDINKVMLSTYFFS